MHHASTHNIIDTTNSDSCINKRTTMKTTLLSLSAISIASASTIRGQVKRKKAEQIPLPDTSCLRKAVDACEQELSSDGNSNCIWCQTSEDEGGCFSNRDAKNLIEMLGQSCPNYTESIVEANPPDFNCFHNAWNGDNAEDTCSESKAKDDSQCVWCQTEDDVSGACLSNQEALIANGKFDLTCPLSVYVEPAEKKVKQGIPDVNCFKAAWIAENAETACGESQDKDGQACVWCQTDRDQAGACLSRAESGVADGQFGLKCPSDFVSSNPLDSK